MAADTLPRVFFMRFINLWVLWGAFGRIFDALGQHLGGLADLLRAVLRTPATYSGEGGFTRGSCDHPWAHLGCFSGRAGCPNSSRT